MSSFRLVEVVLGRARHVTTLPLQRGHVFRQATKWWLLSYDTVYSLWPLDLDTETLKCFLFFLVTEALLRCRVVVVTKLKNVACPALVLFYATGTWSVGQVVALAW